MKKKLEQRNLAPIDENLISYLREKYPPLIYKLDQTNLEYINESIFRAGQIDVIEKIEAIFKNQRKG